MKNWNRFQAVLFTALLVPFFLLATSAYSAFNLPPSASIGVSVPGDGTWRRKPVQAPPVISLTGSGFIALALNGAYTEQGATCTDTTDGTITVPAPVFTPALNLAAQGNYVATYTCTDSSNTTDTITRTVGVGGVQYVGFGPQSSTFAADNGFDFAETFDGLQTWRPAGGRVGNVHYGAASLPKLADGVTPSALDYYSSWSFNPPTQDWIGAYGDNRVWRGTKSAAIDMGREDGPSRLGLYAGSGYRDFRLFFMVNIPKSEFPTFTPTPNTLPSTYTEGDPYVWFSSWKFNTFNIDCPQAGCPDRETYSATYHMLTHFKRNSYITPTSLALIYEDINYTTQPSPRWSRDINNIVTGMDNRFGNWFGLEYHVRLNDTKAVYSTWVYDVNGNAIKIQHDNEFDLPVAARGLNWNQFFWGGNNSGTYVWGPTMQSVYYVDDLVIDAGSKGQIGPRYFNAINN